MIVSDNRYGHMFSIFIVEAVPFLIARSTYKKLREAQECNKHDQRAPEALENAIF